MNGSLASKFKQKDTHTANHTLNLNDFAKEELKDNFNCYNVHACEC